MKTILTAFNARYTHSSLAIRYIKEYNSDKDIEIAEFTINEGVHTPFSRLLKMKGDIYCFSVYIWNVEITLKVAQMLKTALPDVKIVLGGPECTYCPEKILQNNPFIDYVILGEGEAVTGLLIDNLSKGGQPNIKGVAYRGFNGGIADYMDLSSVKFPYNDKSLGDLKNKIVYFETSRGCPFKCSYCLSSAEKGIRYFPDEYVKAGFDTFFKNQVPLVKLIDRTFNADTKRAEWIIKYIMEHSKNTKVHFEIDPSILTESLAKLLASAPEGMFQIEMGIQSINSKTLKAINRRNDTDKITKNIKLLKESGNIHIHLDLIAGLPFEDYRLFEKSFNYVYSLKPDMLQLGFLKVLHGTEIAKRDDINYCKFPPYEVVSTKWLSAEEICRLKLMDKAVDEINNSGAFKRVLEKIAGDNPFKAFEKLSDIFDTGKSISRFEIYNYIYKMYGDEIKIELCMDFMENCRNRPMPEFAGIIYPEGFKKKCTKLVVDERFCHKFNVKSLNDVRFEPIDGKVYMVNYDNGILSDVTKFYIKEGQ